MRQAFVKAVTKLMEHDDRVVLILGDISVFAFREVFDKHPTRCYNVGVCEQAMVGLAAGLAKQGFYPVVHTIAPFLVERAFEQLKIDFGYQQLSGLFVSVGASYDYASLGCTHHCPGDVALLKTIPNMRIYVPAAAKDAEFYILHAIGESGPTYVRLAEDDGQDAADLDFAEYSWCEGNGSANFGLISIGPTRELVNKYARWRGCDTMHIDRVAPFPRIPPTRPLIVVEPFYAGTLAYEFAKQNLKAYFHGVPHRFLTNYGSRQQHDDAIGMSIAGLQVFIQEETACGY